MTGQTRAARLALIAALAAAAAPAPANGGDGAAVGLSLIGRYDAGAFDEDAAEQLAYHPGTKRVYVVNGGAGRIDVLDLSDPARPTKAFAIPVADIGAAVNHVAVHGDVLAVSASAEPITEPGAVGFYDPDGRLLSKVGVGARPDVIAFSPDGRWLVSADEGTPSADYRVDPETSISIIDISGGVRGLDQSAVRTVRFAGFAGGGLPEGMHPGRPESSDAQNLEFSYVAISPDSRTAYLPAQESNALAVVDLAAGEIERVLPFGFVDRRRVPFDASDRDGGIRIAEWPVLAMYQPHPIVAAEVAGRTLLFTANEGEARDYPGWSERKRVKELALDATAFPDAARLKDEANLGRLWVSTASGDDDGDGDMDRLFTFGTRSFSIWDGNGNLVFDSGATFETKIAEVLPAHFNSTPESNDSFDQASDGTGPEPQGIAVARLAGRTYAFIALEAIGGVMVYDATVPEDARFVAYVTSRDFSGEPQAGTAGDLGPNGLIVVDAEDSPDGTPLLLVANETSGTTAVFRIEVGTD